MNNKENIKYFLMDLDNTFLKEDKTVPKENLRALAKLKNMGIKVILCSGRSNMSLDVYAEKLGLNYKNNYIIAYNGCRIYEADTKKVLYEELLDKNTAISISNIVTKLIENTLCYYNGNLYSETENFITKRYAQRSSIKLNIVEKLSDVMRGDIQKIIMIDSHEKLINAYKKVTELLGDNIPAQMFFSSHDLFEFSAKGKTKGTALIKLSQILNEPLYRFAAIGDNENDADMIQYAGIGIAVANAVESCKLNADFVTEQDCNNGGFAYGAEYVISANRGK